MQQTGLIHVLITDNGQCLTHRSNFASGTKLICGGKKTKFALQLLSVDNSQVQHEVCAW